MPGPLERPTSPAAQSTYTTRSIFPSTPSFDLETFADRDFLVKDFIESLSDAAVPANRRSGPASSQAFDPRPLIRAFEHAQARLQDLSSEHEQKEIELSAAVRRVEAQHNANLASLGKKLDGSIVAFRNLDSSLNGYGEGGETGGNVAVRVGEKLEELDRQRVRAQDTKFLIQCWFEVSERGELFLLEDMRLSTSSEKKIQCAKIARQLLKMSQRLDTAHWAQSNGRASALNGVNGVDKETGIKHNTREIVEKFRESLETDLLKQFDEFYRRADFDGMRECATVLEDFNGGASVIGLFVNQHQFFIDRNQLITEEIVGESELWERVADPDAEPPGVEASLQSLVDEVKVVAQEESTIIKRAFPYYELVLGRFLQRVFQQSIQQRLEMVLEKANTISTLAFLRTLQASRSYIGSLIDAMKSHGLTEHPEPLSSQTVVVLDQQFDDLFVPYFVGNSYIDREKRNLEELYTSLLFKFTVYHSRRRKQPTTFLGSLAKSGSEILSSARDAYVERLDSSELAPQQKARLLRIAGLRDKDSAKKAEEIVLNEQDGLLSTSNAKRMLRWLAEAVGRLLELSGGNETPRDVSVLLELLLNEMGHLYVETALDAANESAVAQENSKTEPDLSYLDNLSSVITIMHLMVTCINTVLIPLASSHTTVRREMEKTTAKAMSQIEDKVNGLMQRTIDVAINWTTKLLGRQQKTDFRPRDDVSNSYLELLQTPTCQSVFTFLSRVQHLALLALSPSANLTAFLLELATSVRSLLLSHFTKFQVSAMGGIMVTKDISKYNELLRAWELGPEFQPSIDVLTEVGNLFVIGPDALRERVGGKIGSSSWDKVRLRPYVERREDVGSVAIQSILSTL